MKVSQRLPLTASNAIICWLQRLVALSGWSVSLLAAQSSEAEKLAKRLASFTKPKSIAIPLALRIGPHRVRKQEPGTAGMSERYELRSQLRVRPGASPSRCSATAGGT
jgi:hypothetical protein